MRVFARHTVLILLVWLVSAGVCLGKQVYLKDGGIIDSQSAWRQGEKVFVKVNRDIVAEFALNEIDLRRTFPKTGSSASHLRRKTAAVAVTSAAKPAEAESAEAKPAPTPAVATAAPKAVVKPTTAATAAAPAPAVPPAVAPAPVVIKHPLPAAVESQKSVMPGTGDAAQQKSGLLFLAPLAMLAVCLLIIAAQWIIFARAGQAGWKSLVPFYNMYILMEISGKPGWWMFLLFIPVVNLVFFLLAMLSLAKKFGRSELFGVGITILPMIFLPLLAFGGSEYEG